MLFITNIHKNQYKPNYKNVWKSKISIIRKLKL